MKDMKAFAKADRRSISDYIIILFEDHIAAKKAQPKTPVPHVAAPPATTSPTGIRPAILQTKPLPNVDAIINDEKGWEHGK